MALSTKAKLRLKWAGRAVFFVLLLTQCSFLTAFIASYQKPAWSAVVIAYLLVVVMWIWVVVVPRVLPGLSCKHYDEPGLPQFFAVWFVYIYVALFPNIVMIFGFTVDNLDKNKFLSPNVLKIVLCITPLLLLLLLTTADCGDDTDNDDKKLRRELVCKLCVQMAIDLLDTIEMLDIVLDEKENNYGISKGFEIATVVVACVSFLLSPWQMVEVKFEDGQPQKQRHKTTLIRIIVGMVGVNFTFLIIRLIVFFKYGKEESIFIAKNGIALLLSSLEIYYFVDARRERDGMDWT